MSNDYQAVLFDLDGTLLDTAPDLAAACNQALQHYGYPPQPLQQMRSHVSKGAAALIKQSLRIDTQHPHFQPMLQYMLHWYAHHLSESTTLFPGMARLLTVLEQQGKRWGVITNKPHRFTLPLMQQMGLAERAACIISGDTLLRRKPDPAPLLHASRWLNCPPQHCLYIGDALTDMLAGRAAGMTTLAALYGYLDISDQPYDWPADGFLQQPLSLLRWLASAEQ